MKHEPLSITAHLQGPIAMPGGALAIDGILASAVCLRDRIPPATTPSEIIPIEIPIQRSPCGKFHLASFATFVAEEYENRWLNRRFPVAEGQMFGDKKLRTINVQGGPGKSYRLPLETMHLQGDQLRWWCIGDAEQIRGLLDLVWFVGKKRSTGLGRIVKWDVEPCEPWYGFPVVLAGKPLRNLPIDWPGLDEPEIAWRCLSYPYWDRTKEQECAVAC